MGFDYSPVIYHPSTVVFIDDNESFLNSLSLIQGDYIPKLFTKAKEALATIDAPYQSNIAQMLERCLNLDDSNPLLSSEKVEIDMSNIYRHVYDKNRFDIISTIVVDYDMPEINGLDLLRQIKNPAVKKILLTGVADEKIGLEAFNEGIIDRFIFKTSDGLNQLKSSILMCQKQYFANVFSEFNKMLFKQGERLVSNSVHLDILNQYFEKMDLCELYLLNKHRSYLFLDRLGKPYWMFWLDQDDMNMYYELAIDSNASNEVLQNFQDGDKMPVFYDRDIVNKISGDEWLQYFRDASKIKIGQKDYYYTMIADQFFNLEPDKITPFEAVR